jgi:plasmid stabilization system protein ParE
MNEVVLLLGADGDLIELFNRFEEWRPGMGAEFDRDLVKACQLLSANPKIGPSWRGSFRRLLMLHWNLAIYYELGGGRILVHGIMDLRRDPDHIVRRLDLSDD